VCRGNAATTSTTCAADPGIRELLYEQGFTISGARNRLDESLSSSSARSAPASASRSPDGRGVSLTNLKQELKSVIDLLR
jgi:hypothetical protein